MSAVINQKLVPSQEQPELDYYVESLVSWRQTKTEGTAFPSMYWRLQKRRNCKFISVLVSCEFVLAYVLTLLPGRVFQVFQVVRGEEERGNG